MVFLKKGEIGGRSSLRQLTLTEHLTPLAFEKCLENSSHVLTLVRFVLRKKQKRTSSR